MSSGEGLDPRLLLIERQNTTIRREQETISAAAGLVANSAGVGPGAGVMWRVDFLSVNGEFGAAPSGGDHGAFAVELRRAGLVHASVGGEVVENLGVARVARGQGAALYMLVGDTMIAYADARGSSVAVECVAQLWGIQFTVF